MDLWRIEGGVMWRTHFMDIQLHQCICDIRIYDNLRIYQSWESHIKGTARADILRQVLAADQWKTRRFSGLTSSPSDAQNSCAGNYLSLLATSQQHYQSLAWTRTTATRPLSPTGARDLNII